MFEARQNARRTIRQSIAESALCMAQESVRNKRNSFSFMGKLFHLEWLDSHEAYVTCQGVDAGIRVLDGVAMLI